MGKGRISKPKVTLLPRGSPFRREERAQGLGEGLFMAEDSSPLRRIEGLEKELGDLFHLGSGLRVGLKGGGLYPSHP